MTSKVAIANRALTKLGAARILSMDDDNTQGRAVSSLYDTVRDAELRAKNWRFAIKRASLPALSTTPAWGFSVQYQLPSDCLRIVQVGEYYLGPSMADYRTGPDIPFRIEGQQILTDIDAPLKVRYIFRETDPTHFDACFVEAFACRLAAELAEPLTQSNTKRKLAWDEREQALKDALRANAIESPPTPLPDDSWVISRL